MVKSFFISIVMKERLELTEDIEGSACLDVFFKKVTPGQMVDLLRGLKKASDLVCAQRPEGLILPGRGMWPLVEMLSILFPQKVRHKVPLVFIPLGTHKDPETGSMFGITAPEKEERVKKMLSIYNLSSAKRLMLIDEAVSGGTVLELVNILERIRRDTAEKYFNLSVVVLESTLARFSKKARGFKRLTDNERPGVTCYVIRVPMVFLDRDLFLPTILGREGEPILPLPHILVNEELNCLLRSLAYLFRGRKGLRGKGDFSLSQIWKDIEDIPFDPNFSGNIKIGRHIIPFGVFYNLWYFSKKVGERPELREKIGEWFEEFKREMVGY